MFFEHNDIIASAHWNNFLPHKTEIAKDGTFAHDLSRVAKYHKYRDCGYPVKQQSYAGSTSGFNGFKQLYETVAEVSIQDRLKYSDGGSNKSVSTWKYDILHRYKIKELVYYLINCTVCL